MSAAKPASTFLPRWRLGLGLLLGLTGCGAASIEDPYYVMPPPVIKSPGAKPLELVAICQDGSKAQTATVQKMIAQSCQGARLLRRDFSGSCTIAVPERLTYRCTAVNRALVNIQAPFGQLQHRTLRRRTPAADTDLNPDPFPTTVPNPDPFGIGTDQ